MKAKFIILIGIAIAGFSLLTGCCCKPQPTSYEYEYGTACGKQSCTDNDSLDLTQATPPPSPCVTSCGCGKRYVGQG